MINKFNTEYSEITDIPDMENKHSKYKEVYGGVFQELLKATKGLALSLYLYEKDNFCIGKEHDGNNN